MITLVLAVSLWAQIRPAIVAGRSTPTGCQVRIVSATSLPLSPVINVTLRGDARALECVAHMVETGRHQLMKAVAR